MKLRILITVLIGVGFLMLITTAESHAEESKELQTLRNTYELQLNGTETPADKQRVLQDYILKLTSLENNLRSNMQSRDSINAVRNEIREANSILAAGGKEESSETAVTKVDSDENVYEPDELVDLRKRFDSRKRNLSGHQGKNELLNEYVGELTSLENNLRSNMREIKSVNAVRREIRKTRGEIESAKAANQIINVQKLDSAPTVDGNAEEWKKVQTVNIPLSGKLGNHEVSVKAGVFGDSVYFLWQWKDTSEDIEHKPFVWNEELGKYTTGSQMEDRLAVTFAMEGDFTSDWISGKTFKADMWHWKAARSNPLGLAHDKMTIVTKEPAKGSYKATARDNSYIYILRPSDEGDELYSTRRYAVKDKAVMPKYILAADPKGSVADVKAKGVWSNGTWTLEESRLLATGHADDVIFKPGTAVPSAIAVFNHSENEDHNISETIVFKFPK